MSATDEDAETEEAKDESGKDKKTKFADSKGGKKAGWDRAGVIFQGVSAIAVPVSIAVLIVGVFQFKSQQKTAADQALNQQRQATLENYLNDISTLVLSYRLSGRKPDDGARALAVARTDTAVRSLDGFRKGILIRYLWEADLIRGRSPIVGLHKVNLQGAVFRGAYLYGADLSTDDLVKADFYGADMYGAILSWANLSGANLDKANLGCFTTSQFDVSLELVEQHVGSVDCTDLKKAVLDGAHLQDANLIGANLTGAYLTESGPGKTDLTGARYNVKPIIVRYRNGDSITIPTTQWPRGFSPVAAGADCIDCS